jgi:hypothetical protein
LVTCDKCGAELALNEWPWCPHGAARSSVVGDEIDYIDHNLGAHPIHITSRSQRRQLMAERGLVEKVRHMPTPGSDTSPHTQSFATVDLEAAAYLVTHRMGGASAAEQTPDTADHSGVRAAWHSPGQRPDWSLPE